VKGIFTSIPANLSIALWSRMLILTMLDGDVSDTLQLVQVNDCFECE
jgi:hypothetical protein